MATAIYNHIWNITAGYAPRNAVLHLQGFQLATVATSGKGIVTIGNAKAVILIEFGTHIQGVVSNKEQFGSTDCVMLYFSTFAGFSHSELKR